MKKLSSFIIVTLLLTFPLAGCSTSSDDTPTMAVNSELGETTTAITFQPPTPMPTNTLAPTKTPAPTSTSLPPTPALSHATVDDLIFGGSSSDCQLPCWHGLRINESGYEDVQRMFDEVFNFSGFLYPLPENIISSPTGYDRIGHVWDLSVPREHGDFITVLTWMNIENGKLEAIVFVFQVENIELRPDISFQRIVRELGIPDEWLVAAEPGGQGAGTHLGFRSLMIYDNGVSITHYEELPTSQSYVEDKFVYEPAEWCLGSYGNGTFTIGNPLTDGFNDLSPLQEMAYVLRGQLQPIEDVLNLSLEEITQRAVQEENPCFIVSPTEE